MSLPELKLEGCGGGRTETGTGLRPASARRRRLVALRWLSAFMLAAGALAAQFTPAHAQRRRDQPGTGQGAPAPSPTPYAQCPPEMAIGLPYVAVPEIAAGNDGVLRGTVMLGSEKRWMATRLPFNTSDWAPANNSQSQCNTPFVRFFTGLNTVQFVMNDAGAVVSKPYSNSAATDSSMHISLPMPGPTLRARVGSLVELGFINIINPQDFGDSIDNDEKGRGGGCDETSAGYPGLDRPYFPDCFHGSSTGNIHFHGTHTNPNTTGDNVFIEVRPANRENGKLTDPPDKVDKWFQEFFTRCERTLTLGFGGGTFLREWPNTWADLPKGWTDYQLDQLQKYDEQLRKAYPHAGIKSLRKVDEDQLREDAWPQYYVGSYPYCFRLPDYTAPTYPPPAPAQTQNRQGGTGTAEGGHAGMGMGGMQVASDTGHGDVLQMGQSPGTHWYHAHKHGSTAINVANGMTGAFIIEGKYDDDLNAWYGYGTQWTRTQPVMVINQLGQSPNLMAGSGQDKGPDFSVNGRQRPVLTMQAGEVQMFRILNTSGRAGIYFEGPPKGFEWRQLAQDGVQFSDRNYLNRKPEKVVASGNRMDLLVKAPAAPTCAQPDPEGNCSYAVTVKNIVDLTDLQSAKIRPLTLFTIKVVPASSDLTTKYPNRTKFIPHAPSFPAFLKSITDDEIKGTKTIVFASTKPESPPAPPKSGFPTMHMIDGKRFDGEVGAVALLNTAEEWKIVNQSYPSTAVVSHPFHIHINPFQVTEVFDPNEQLIDPTTQKPVFNSDGSPVSKYVISKTGMRPGQCYLDMQNPATWVQMLWRPGAGGKGGTCTPLTAADFDNDNIWWDVFPIPSGIEPQHTEINPKTGKPFINPKNGKPQMFPYLKLDPKTGKPVIDPKTNQTVPIQIPGYFKMRSRFVDYPGFYVLHCHILAHEDRGMMTIVEVAPARTPYSHH